MNSAGVVPVPWTLLISRDCIRDTINLPNTIPGIDDIDCSLSDDCDYAGDRALPPGLWQYLPSNGTDTRHLDLRPKRQS